MQSIIDGCYRWLLRPLLFLLPPETAQKIADFALSKKIIWQVLSSGLQIQNGRLFVDLCGITLENPVGLAAGYDKDCELIPGLSRLGFGYITVGTVTELPRPGNARPRIVRIRHRNSLVNGLGFPSNGLESATSNLENIQDQVGSTFVIVSVAGTSIEEFARCHRQIESLADAVELNISSPNTEGLKIFQQPESLSELVSKVNEKRKKPLLIKMPWYDTVNNEFSVRDRERGLLINLTRACCSAGVDGLTVANSRPISEPRLSTGNGGLSGQPTFENMLTMVSDARGETGGKMGINACGGIFSGADAWKAIQAGATTVQLLTGLVYKGPGIASHINKDLLSIMDKEEIDALMYDIAR